MKKISLLIITMLFMFVGCASTNSKTAPDLPTDGCYLIDLRSIDYPDDYVKVHNGTSEEYIDVRVYVYNDWGKKWEMLGIASLNGYDDIDTIFDGPFANNSLEGYRWVAIQFRSGEDYDFTTSNIRDDLHIFLLDKGEWN